MTNPPKVDCDKWVRVTGRAMGTSPLAVRISVDGKMEWLPRSVLRDEGECVDAVIRNRIFLGEVELDVAIWKAREKGWT